MDDYFWSVICSNAGHTGLQSPTVLGAVRVYDQWLSEHLARRQFLSVNVDAHFASAAKICSATRSPESALGVVMQDMLLAIHYLVL